MAATSRKIDDNGFLLVEGCPITSFGIFVYSAGQVGLPGDPMRMVNVYRPESAVNNPATIASFMNVPLIDDHEMLSGFAGDKENTAPEDYGVSGVLTSNVYYAAPWMRGDLKVFSRQMRNDLAQGKKDLSLGYACDYEETPGVFEGQAYEVVQTNLRGNHIALVAEGRVPGARVLDGLCFDHLCFDFKSSSKENTMTLKAKKAMDKAARDSAVAQLQTLIPQLSTALEGFLAEEAGEAAHAEPEAGAVPAVAEVAAEPAVAVAPVVDAEAGAEPAAAAPATPVEGAEAPSDLPALISAAEAAIAALKAACATPAADNEGMPVVDNVEGLNDQSTVQGAQVSTDALPEEPGAAIDNEESEMEGKPGSKAGDAALRGFYADSAAKARIYDRLSTVVGAFDCAAMDARQVAAYGVKKLGIACDSKFAPEALDAYLSGVEKAARQVRITQSKAADAAAAPSAESKSLDQYINGSAS